MPILIRHQTVKPYATAAANASQFEAQREVNNEGLRWNAFVSEQQNRQNALAQNDAHFQQQLAQAQAEQDQQDQLRRDLQAQEAQNRLAIEQQQGMQKQLQDKADFERSIQTALIGRQGQDQRGAADRASREKVAEENRKAMGERTAQSNARQGAQTFMREAGGVISSGLKAAGEVGKAIFTPPKAPTAKPPPAFDKPGTVQKYLRLGLDEWDAIKRAEADEADYYQRFGMQPAPIEQPAPTTQPATQPTDSLKPTWNEEAAGVELKPIRESEARKIMAQAGGDPARARQLALQMGYDPQNVLRGE